MKTDTLALSQKLRRIISWIIAIAAIAFIILTPLPDQRSVGYLFLKLTGYVLVILATFGRVWCTIYIGGRKDKELCAEGPYSVCRNPLYGFSFLGVAGIAAGAQNLPLLLGIIPIFWGYYYFVIIAEEQQLREQFGSDFAKYCSRVNRILPNFKTYQSKETIEVNTRLVIRSMLDAMWFAWMIIFLEILEYWKMTRFNGFYA